MFTAQPSRRSSTCTHRYPLLRRACASSRIRWRTPSWPGRRLRYVYSEREISSRRHARHKLAPYARVRTGGNPRRRARAGLALSHCTAADWVLWRSLRPTLKRLASCVRRDEQGRQRAPAVRFHPGSPSFPTSLRNVSVVASFVRRIRCHHQFAMEALVDLRWMRCNRSQITKAAEYCAAYSHIDQRQSLCARTFRSPTVYLPTRALLTT